jgi:hypothetical protein
VEVLFTIGLGVEVAGAALLAWEAMTTIRGTWPSVGGAEQQVPRGRAIVGFLLLALGVVVQLAGYAVAHVWLLAVAVGAIVAGLIAGRWVADGPVLARLTRSS